MKKKNLRADVSYVEKRIKYWVFFAYFCPLENSSKGKPDLGVDQDHLCRITLKIEGKADQFFTPFGQAPVQRD